jgi:hypothetical protein
MSDITPNLDLRKKRIQVKISELALNVERMDLRKMELAEEGAKIDENLLATTKAIEALNKELGE